MVKAVPVSDVDLVEADKRLLMVGIELGTKLQFFVRMCIEDIQVQVDMFRCDMT